MRSRIGTGKDQEYVVALLFVASFELQGSVHFTDTVLPHSLDIPANNCAIFQRGDDLELVPAGQHYITNPNVTLRGLYTLGENQLEMPTKDM